MIYNDSENQELKIVEFGHGSVKICPTNDPETMIANGVAFIHDNDSKPIGTHNPEDMGKDVRDFDNIVLLKFLKVESLDMLIEDLNTVRRGMIEQKSVQEAQEKDGGTGADITINSLTNENTNLRAKLEAAEKEKVMWFNKYNRSADNETILFEQACKVAKERDNLQKQLEAANLSNMNNESLARKYLQERDNLQQELLELKAERESDRQECHACSKHKDNLQAANGVLRGALGSTRDIIYDILPTGDVSGDKTVKPLIGCIRSIDNVLKSTPAESGERVQEIIELLQDAINETKNGEKLSTGFVAAAEDALNKYMGGANGE